MNHNEVTWYLDDHQTPEAVGPLSQSVYPYIFRTYGKVQRKRGREHPAVLRIRFDHGYFYVDFRRPKTPFSPEGMEEARLSPRRLDQEWLPEIKANVARLNSLSLADLADDQLADVLADGLAVLTRHWEIHHSLAFRAVDDLVKWYAGRFPDAPKGEGFRLLQGQSNLSVETAHALWQLSRTAPRQFDAALATFLDVYGRRTSVYCDIGSPTWQEEPGLVHDMLLQYADDAVADPLDTIRTLAAERDQFTADVRGQLAPDEVATFDDLLDLARIATRLREDHAFWIEGETMAAVRRICVEFGRRLTEEGYLRSANEVALLTVEELLGYGYTVIQADLTEAELERRRAQYAADKQATPAPWVGAAPEDEDEPREESPDLIEGMGVSAGVRRGPARVVHSLAEARSLKRGEVLVCRETDPGWAPLFVLAGALVLDSFAGGMLAHAAIVAREYRLPAVVDAAGALKRITTGQMIEVDGTTGSVRIL